MPSSALASLYITLMCLIWGSTWFVIRVGLRDLPPFQSAAVRFAIAAAVMTLVAHFARKREGGTAPPFWLSFALGTLNFAASYAFVYWSETRIPSALACVLWSVYPLMMAASGHLFLAHERLRARQWLGFVLGFVGVGLLFLTDLPAISSEAIVGGCVLLGSPLVATVGTTLVKKHGGGTSSLLLNRNGMWIGALTLALLSFGCERDAPAHWTPGAIASVAYLALAGTAFTFGIYFWLLRHTSAYRMSLISYATPPVAIAIGAFIGDEPITGWTIGGMAAILGGVLLVMGGKRSPSTKSS
ncbi:MAG: DMT family transporter [Planctomycetes bacterium]|nr:DMT family transporter [Planctomycetota bacterium]